MLKPNYKDGSIVNLMSTIAQKFGKRHQYNTLKLLSPKKLSDNVVLIILDGLGYEYLKNCKDSFMFQHLKGSMNSVYPPTTATAITTFMTGTAPQQHAFTGWYMHLKEIGIVSTVLRFIPRAGGSVFSKSDIRMKDILDCGGFSEKLKAKSFIINNNMIIDSDFNKRINGNSKILGYSHLDEMFHMIVKSVKSKGKKKYIYSYWPMFDSYCHEKGVASRKAKEHFKALDIRVKHLAKVLAGTGTTIIVTADHGFMDVPKSRMIRLEDHPKLEECLTLPLCGDSRTKYCYVHPSKARQFEAYVRDHFKDKCELYKSEDLVKMGVFGLFRPNPKLFDRIGDYALIAKGNYAFSDRILSQENNDFIGHHGGSSKEELLVPLVVIDV